MRKIADLNGDEFFDFMYALSPILPVISQLEVVKSGFAVITNYAPTAEDIAKIKSDVEKSKSKKKLTDEELAAQLKDNVKLRAEVFTLIAKELPILIPHITSKENRVAVYDALSILEEMPVDEIKAWPAPKLMKRVAALIKDPGIKDFLAYAEPVDTDESSQ